MAVSKLAELSDPSVRIEPTYWQRVVRKSSAEFGAELFGAEFAGSEGSGAVFTGIVEELGTVVAVQADGDAAHMVVRGALVTSDARLGDSIAVNGVCLTVAALDPGSGEFTADVMAETLRRSTLGELRAGSRVNLERPLRIGDRLGGHLVQGHVDGVGVVVARAVSERWEDVRVAVPAGLARYVVEKGSITLDGASLTVTGVGAEPGEGPWLSVSLIPTTLELTTLGRAAVGAKVNVEVDIIGKYVERLLAPSLGGGA